MSSMMEEVEVDRQLALMISRVSTAQARLRCRVIRAFALLLVGWHVAAVAAAERDASVPIRVGAVSTLTGAAAFRESTDAVRAYFDYINSTGGIRGGRKLELMVQDDAGDPATARVAAQKLIDDKTVVALVGGASIVDCTANGSNYRRAGLIAIQGTGVEPGCFNSSNIVPVNTGPYLSLRSALQFAHTTLRRKRICAFLNSLPGMDQAVQETVDAWTKQNGSALAHTAFISPNDDTQLLVQRAVDRGCEALVHTGVEPMVIEWARAAHRSGQLAGVPTIFLTPAYTSRVAAELTAMSGIYYSMSEFEPWSSRSLTLTTWRSTMQRGKVPLSSFSQGGYSAAQLLVRVLLSMTGDISRERVTQAVLAVKDMDLPMVGTRITVGADTAHNPNRANLPMVLEGGAWRIAAPYWIVSP